MMMLLLLRRARQATNVQKWRRRTNFEMCVEPRNYLGCIYAGHNHHVTCKSEKVGVQVHGVLAVVGTIATRIASRTHQCDQLFIDISTLVIAYGE